MVLEIPYTFEPGTKAKASEVNADFEAIKSFVDGNEQDIARIQEDILELENDKADKNGDILQRFNVADVATTGGEYNAVNLQTYKKLSANTIDLIQGYQLAKFDNNSITAQPGSCYDSTKSIIITSDATLTATQANLTANATYYVYVTYDNETLALVIDLSNSAPGGYTNYRQLGYFKTDSNGYINANTISYYGIGGDSDKSAARYSHATMPNYSSRISRAWNTSYTADTDGWVFLQTRSIDDRGDHIVTITYNGVSTDFSSAGNTTASEWFRYNLFIAVPRGATWTTSGDATGVTLYWIPCIGGN